MDILYFVEQLEMSNKHKKKFTPTVNHKNTNLFYLSGFLKHSKIRKKLFLIQKTKEKITFSNDHFRMLSSSPTHTFSRKALSFMCVWCVCGML